LEAEDRSGSSAKLGTGIEGGGGMGSVLGLVGEALVDSLSEDLDDGKVEIQD
jgi:hypothetical protein